MKVQNLTFADLLTDLHAKNTHLKSTQTIRTFHTDKYPRVFQRSFAYVLPVEEQRTEKQQLAEKVVAGITEKLKRAEQDPSELLRFEHTDENGWLKIVQEHFGEDPLLKSPEAFVQKIEGVSEQSGKDAKELARLSLEKLAQTMQVLAYADSATDTRFAIGENISIPVANPNLMSLLKKDTYTAKEIETLGNTLEAMGTLKIHIDERNGLPITAPNTTSNNMAGLRWVTDTLRIAEALREKHPEEADKMVLAITESYLLEHQLAAFAEVFANPATYSGGLYKKKDGGELGGPHHVVGVDAEGKLMPAPVWEKTGRLESHALALRNLCALAMKDPSKIDENHLAVIANLARFIGLVDTESVGPWEENPFKYVLSDVALSADALGSFRDLMFSDRPDLRPVQDALKEYNLLNSTQERLGLGIFTNREVLQRGIDRRIQFVQDHTGKGSSPDRKLDASTAWLMMTDVPLAKDPLESVRVGIGLLEELESGLVGEYGMRRYGAFKLPGSSEETNDSYLGPNYDVMLDPRTGKLSMNRFFEMLGFGDRDLKAKELTERAKASGDKTENVAQWFPIHYIGLSYAKAAQQLIEIYEGLEGTDQKARRQEIKRQIDSCFGKSCEYLTRGVARVLPDDHDYVVASGEIRRGATVPEAFQTIVVKTQDGTVKEVRVPGKNSNLAWGAGSLKLLISRTKALSEQMEQMKAS